MELGVLVLVALDKQYKDVAGTEYSGEGYISFNDFVSNQDIRSGLSGILWGVSSSLDQVLYIDKDTQWAVVKVDEQTKKIDLDPAYNLIKFSEGFVTYIGDISSASTLIHRYRRNNNLADIEGYEICGTESHAGLPSHHAISTGFGGAAFSEVGGLHAIVASNGSKVKSTEFESHALGLGNHVKAGTLGDFSHALTSGKGSISKTCGDESVAIAMDAGSKALSSGSNSVSICLKPGGIAAAGIKGSIIMAYEEGGDRKFAIGQVGEDVRACQMYRCEGGEFVEVK